MCPGRPRGARRRDPAPPAGAARSSAATCAASRPRRSPAVPVLAAPPTYRHAHPDFEAETVTLRGGPPGFVLHALQGDELASQVELVPARPLVDQEPQTYLKLEVLFFVSDYRYQRRRFLQMPVAGERSHWDVEGSPLTLRSLPGTRFELDSGDEVVILDHDDDDPGASSARHQKEVLVKKNPSAGRQGHAHLPCGDRGDARRRGEARRGRHRPDRQVADRAGRGEATHHRGRLARRH